MTFSVYQIDELEAWLALDDDAAFTAGTPEYRYETRLAMVDDLKCRNVVEDLEWGKLVEEAVGAYANEST